MSGQWNPFRLTAEGRSSPVLASVILAVFVAGTLFLSFHHEPWRDEADSWLVSRDASITTILHWTRYAGTPALWNLLLKPLVWMGLPYSSQQILHLVLAWAAAALFLFRAPFTWPVKLLILFSYYFAFEYAVIARSYVLDVLLIFLIAQWYPARFQQPLPYAIAIALLFNVNLHGAIMAGVLMLLFVLPSGIRNVPRLPVATMIAGAVAAWAQIRPVSDSTSPDLVRHIHSWVPMMAIDTAFFPGPWLTGSANVALLLIVLIAASLRRHLESVLFLILSVALLVALYMLVWFGGHRHGGLIFLVVVAAIWMAREVKLDPISASAALLLNLTLLLSCFFTAQVARSEVKFAFSGSREMASFIRQHRLDRYPIAAHQIQPSEAVLAWLPGKRFWYPAVERSGSYSVLNREEAIHGAMRHATAVERAVSHFAPSGERWLMLLNAPMPEGITGFRLLYATKRPQFRNGAETYWLYEWRGISDARPGKRRLIRRSS